MKGVVIMQEFLARTGLFAIFAVVAIIIKLYHDYHA
jgi:hypothetical protein